MVPHLRIQEMHFKGIHEMKTRWLIKKFCTNLIFPPSNFFLFFVSTVQGRFCLSRFFQILSFSLAETKREFLYNNLPFHPSSYLLFFWVRIKTIFVKKRTLRGEWIALYSWSCFGVGGWLSLLTKVSWTEKQLKSETPLLFLLHKLPCLVNKESLFVISMFSIKIRQTFYYLSYAVFISYEETKK